MLTYQKSGTRDLGPSTWDPLPGTWDLICGNLDPIPLRETQDPYLGILTLIQLSLNPIQEGRSGKKASCTSFSPVTSTSVGASP